MDVGFPFIEEFYEKMKNVDLTVLGLIDTSNNIHTLGSDSKILGRVFEMITQPVLEAIAEEHGLILRTPTEQTRYPDFILMKDESSREKIAIDVKSTYRRYTAKGNVRKYGFTLGSYASYMRDGQKNIAYHYKDYIGHYVIGFVYDRNDRAQESKVFALKDCADIQLPYKNVEFFIQEKYKIAGEIPGSGNTENIGSFTANSIQPFRQGNGKFAALGETVYSLYWRYYPKYRAAEKKYTNLEQFCTWFLSQDAFPELLWEYDGNAVKTVLEEWLKQKANS